MAKPAARIVFLEAVLLLGGAVVVGRSFWLQVVHHKTWALKAASSRETDRDMPARRGRLYDRNGQPLAVSHEQYRVKISLNRVRDTTALRALVLNLPKLSRARVDEQFAKPYPNFQGPFGAEDIEPIRGVRGVRLERLYSRQYPMKSLADRILGRLARDSVVGIEGLERVLDTLLQGQAGREHFLLDSKGNLLPAPGATVVDPVAGHDVTLTIDADMQGIAEGALDQAVKDNKARGGDVVVVDVHTGEIYAIASLRRDTIGGSMVSTTSAIVEPFSPGSTSKLFTVAAMLRFGSDTTPVDGENGHWMMDYGRPKLRAINDVSHLHGPVTVGMAVKFSSNVAMSKFSLKLKSEQQYEAIRDFGFGTSPGLGFPAEAPGRLVRPPWINWRLTQPSLAMGYEWTASALQLAMGFAAIANHGTLMTPSLIREVRDENGVVTWRHRPDTVRQAVPDSIARHMMEYLSMTEGNGGTGAKAQLDGIKVPGKTGTAEVVEGHPEAGYRTSFVGIFPEQSPQIVVYVMVDRPNNGLNHGGDVAAPVVKQFLLQALASTRSPLDRTLLTQATAPRTVQVPDLDSTPVRRVAFPVGAAHGGAVLAVVPSVAGQSLRGAVALLERAGFQARVVGRARVTGTTPSAGDSLPRGTVVTVRADSGQ